MAHERPLAHWPSYALLARASWYPPPDVRGAGRPLPELGRDGRDWAPRAYNVLDLVSVARALRVDLAAFLCDPIPDLPDGEQQQLLATLRDAFMGDDPRAGLARLAHRLADMEPGHELMLVVLPGGQWKVVNRRDALKLGAVLGVSLATPALNPDQAGELVASLESRQITHAGVAALRAVVTAYRRLDDEIGSATLRPLVQHNVQIVKGLQTRSEDLRAAEHAGNDAMAAHVLGWMSYLASTTTHPHEGIRIADAALQRAAKTPSRRLRASLARMKAHAHARAGEARGCEQALGQAATDLAAADPADDPEFIYSFDEAVLLAHAGIVNVLLQQPAQAQAALERSLTMFDPTCVRDRAFHLTWLAAGHVAAREIPQACRIGIEAAALLDQASSERTIRLLKELHGVQLRPHWSVPAVRELGDRLHSL